MARNKHPRHVTSEATLFAMEDLQVLVVLVQCWISQTLSLHFWTLNRNRNRIWSWWPCGQPADGTNEDRLWFGSFWVECRSDAMNELDLHPGCGLVLNKRLATIQCRLQSNFKLKHVKIFDQSPKQSCRVGHHADTSFRLLFITLICSLTAPLISPTPICLGRWGPSHLKCIGIVITSSKTFTICTFQSLFLGYTTLL